MPTKIPLEWHDCIRALYKGGMTQVEIAKALGVSRDRIRQICNFYTRVKSEGEWVLRRIPLKKEDDE